MLGRVISNQLDIKLCLEVSYLVLRVETSSIGENNIHTRRCFPKLYIKVDSVRFTVLITGGMKKFNLNLSIS